MKPGLPQQRQTQPETILHIATYCYILLHIAIAIYYLLHTDLYCTLMFLCSYEALREEAGEYLEVLGIWLLIVTLGTL